jgi:hypothetical protein
MVATLLKFTDSFYPSPRFFTGTGTTQLVPDIFPIAINGRPYLVDEKSNQFSRGFEPAQVKPLSTRKDCGVEVKHLGITVRVKSMLIPLRHKTFVFFLAKV